MTISGLSPLYPLPGMMAAPLATSSQPSLAPLMLGSGVADARAGAAAQPGIASRLMSAMQAALGALRGGQPMPLAPAPQTLALQAQRPVTLPKKPKAKAKRAAPSDQPLRRARKVKSAKTWKTLANQQPKRSTLPAQAQPQAPVQPQQSMMSAPLSNATMLPGATMYSFDQFGNPIPGSLSPAMMQGLQGLVGGVANSGPQVNATNQTNLSGLLGDTPTGTTEPVLGEPVSSELVAGAEETEATTESGSTQSVTNSNVTDVASRQQGLQGYGYLGAPVGGIATPWAPYGASMQGGSGGGIVGWLSRLVTG